MTSRKKIINVVKHFLVALTLILKGVDKISHHAVIGGILLLFGLIIFGFFIYSLVSKKQNEKFELIAHWFEAIAALFAAYVFYTDGATYLPYAYLLAAVIFFIAIYMHYKKHRTHH